MKIYLLFALIGFTFAVKEVEWQQWKTKHSKSYADEAEESVRKLIWQDNYLFVQKHNSENHTFTVETNEFADLTAEEFKKLYLSQINMYSEQKGEMHVVSSERPQASTVDWRTKGVVTGVKNQGQCGSCWSFSTTGSLEGQHAMKSGQLVSLSEQQLVDCSTRYGNHGCSGGLMDNAFKYIEANRGLDTEECYPYRAHNEICEYRTSCIGATLSSYRDITHGSESSLQDAVEHIGPISVAIDAGHRSFQLYKTGIYNEPECSSTKLDHGVLAVGYGTEGAAYWLVKNSWGPGWGMEGYVMMSKDRNNQCGIATQASYPIV
ncbi:digestive cysteine proteinase 2-like isoform X2 [Dysidea avara]|uniref:digestive cysteine proteinase 2-like isoform X2 n=1 Tax=Dysidea avara TaxID=196820 RepID=UPI0033180E35